MATPKIRIRSYNVGFGDCVLVSIPDGAETRHLLVDFGNAPGKAGSNAAFPEIAEDIRRRTGGHLDVVVMTHEHLDHMEGFYSQKAVFDEMRVDQVWMSLPSHPDYYQDYRAAEPLKKLRAAAAAFAERSRARGLRLAPSFAALMRNNLSNRDRIDYLRDLGGRVRYLHRGSRVRGRPASANVRFRFLAPEKDVSVYYAGGGRRLATMADSLAADAAGDGDEPWVFPRAKRRAGAPPNLTAGDWDRLRESIRQGAVEAVRSIDKAANNTSLVFLLEAAGKRLLFPGDAELESWEVMQKRVRRHLKPVDFLKVSHHGSHNGTPVELLDDLLPVARKDRAAVLVSTRSKVYGTQHPVPDAGLLGELRKRCRKLVSTDDVDPEERWVDVEI